MAGRGPAPRPTVFKIAEGNPGKQALNKREPQPKVVEPHMPAWLDQEAATEWRRIVPILMDMRILTEADGIALATYCETYSTYVKASKVLQDDEFTFLNEKTGVAHARPEVQIVQTCRRDIKTFAQEFGMTPSARSRMVMIGQEEDSDGDSMRSLLS